MISKLIRAEISASYGFEQYGRAPTWACPFINIYQCAYLRSDLETLFNQKYHLDFQAPLIYFYFFSITLPIKNILGTNT